MSRRDSRYSFFAAALALTAGVLTFLYLNSVRLTADRMINAKLAAFKNKEPVVVARRNVSAGSVITDADVRLEKIISAYVVPQAVKNKIDVVGQNALADIYQGEQITKGRFGSPESIPAASRMISPGKVVMAVAVDEVSGVGGGVRPGDHVAVFVTFEESNQADLLYTRILVRGIGGMYPYGGAAPSGKKGIASGFGGDVYSSSKGPTTIILEVTKEQAKELTFALERGKIRLALLPAEEE